MDQRHLGSEGLVVSELGLGCMGMSEFYGTGDEEESIATIHRAIDLGITFLDTADMYGPFTNEKLVGKAIAGRRDEVVLATKFGNVRGEDGSYHGVSGEPEIPDLARLHKLLHRTDRLLDGRLRVHAVLVVEIDVVDLEA